MENLLMVVVKEEIDFDQPTLDLQPLRRSSRNRQFTPLMKEYLSSRKKNEEKAYFKKIVSNAGKKYTVGRKQTVVPMFQYSDTSDPVSLTNKLPLLEVDVDGTRVEMENFALQKGLKHAEEAKEKLNPKPTASDPGDGSDEVLYTTVTVGSFPPEYVRHLMDIVSYEPDP